MTEIKKQEDRAHLCQQCFTDMGPGDERFCSDDCERLFNDQLAGATEKPKCQLTGTDGNIFALVGKASATLKKAGLRDEAKTMAERVFASGSYSEALEIIMQYVEVS